MRKHLQGNQGFSLIEMAIVLLIAGLLTAGAVQLMSSMQQQRTDQAAANEARNIITAFERFMVDQQAVLTTNPSPLRNPGNSYLLGNNNLQLDYGAGLTPTLKYFEDNYLNIPVTEPPTSDLRLVQRGYRIGLRNNGIVTGSSKPILKALILRTPTNTMNESRLSRVASLLGSQGGLVRDNGSGGAEISGVQGSWRVLGSDYGFVGGNAPTIGQIAVYTTTIDSNMNTNVLSRTSTGNAEANTMRADLLMGSAAAGSTNAFSIRNAAGYGMLTANVNEATPCDSGTAQIFNNDGVQTGTMNMRAVAGPDDTRQMIITGRDSAGAVRTVLQCRNTSGAWVWEPVGSNNYPTNSDMRLYAENRDMTSFFPGATQTGRLSTGQDSNPTSMLYSNFISICLNTNSCTPNNRNGFAGLQRRYFNVWYWNDSGKPLVVTTFFSDGTDWAYTFVRDNYTAATGGGAPRIASVIKSRDEDGMYTMTAVIPVNAVYAIVIRNNRFSLCEAWIEYSPF